MIPGLPGQISGNQGGVVPATPDPIGEAQKATAPGDQTVAALMQILQQSNRPHVQGQPPAVPGGQQQQSTTPPAYMTQNAAAHSWGPERFMYTLGATINNLGAQKQQRELAHATNQYSALMTSLDKYVGPDGKVSPQAYQDPSVMAVLGNEKELKKMAKALQTDWLNPGKTTPYQQAMGAAIQKRQKQQQGRQGLDKLFHSLVDKATKPKVEMTPEQQQGMAQEIGSKTPTTGASTDPKSAIAALDQITKMQKDAADLDIKNKELEEQKQVHRDTLTEHADALQQRYDSLNAQIQDRKDRLSQKGVSDELRAQNQQQMMELRKQTIGIQQELAQAKLGAAETPKDRQTWVNNTLKELMQNRAIAAKDVADTKKLWGSSMGLRGMPEAQSNFDMANKQIQNLQAISRDVTAGKISTTDAISRIYGDNPSAPQQQGGGQSQQQNPSAPKSVDDEIMNAIPH